MSSKFSYDSKNIKKVIVISLALIIFMTFGNIFEKNKKYEIESNTEKIQDSTSEDEDLYEDVSQQQEETYEKKLESEEQKIFVDITGEVNNPAVVELESESRLQLAIEKAGGLTSKADRNSVNMAQKLVDGAQYIIPQKGEAFIINYSSSQPYSNVSNGNSLNEQNSNDELDGKVNINTASKDKLKELPGIGDVLSQRIIDYRNENGEFKSIDDLREVGGIGEKKFEDIKNYIYV